MVTYISQGDDVTVFPKPQQYLNFFMWVLLLFVHDLQQTDGQIAGADGQTVGMDGQTAGTNILQGRTDGQIAGTDS